MSIKICQKIQTAFHRLQSNIWEFKQLENNAQTRMKRLALKGKIEKQVRALNEMSFSFEAEGVTIKKYPIIENPRKPVGNDVVIDGVLEVDFAQCWKPRDNPMKKITVYSAEFSGQMTFKRMIAFMKKHKFSSAGFRELLTLEDGLKKSDKFNSVIFLDEWLSRAAFFVTGVEEKSHLQYVIDIDYLFANKLSFLFVKKNY